MKSYYYRAFVQDGTNTYSRRPVGVAACSIVACQSDDIKSCPYRFGINEENFDINELEISMITYRDHYNETLQCSDIEYYPVSLRNNKYPLSANNYTFGESKKYLNEKIPSGNKIKNDGFESLIFKILRPQGKLVSFGIWGRIYVRDGGPGEKTENDVASYIELEKVIYEGREVKSN